MSINLGMATIASRIDSLEKVLDSITNQVDNIFLVLNYNGEEPPMFLGKYKNLSWAMGTNVYGDAHKFQVTGFLGTGHYFISWDDDLIMPYGCIRYLCDGVDRYNGLVGLHGRKYLPPVTNFRKWEWNYRCLNTVSEDVKVNFIGSGCAAFHTDRLKLSLSDFKKPFMADCYLSKTASTQGVPMIVLEHCKDYLQYTNPSDTIWRKTRDYSEQVKILRSYIK